MSATSPIVAGAAGTLLGLLHRGRPEVVHLHFYTVTIPLLIAVVIVTYLIALRHIDR